MFLEHLETPQLLRDTGLSAFSAALQGCTEETGLQKNQHIFRFKLK